MSRDPAILPPRTPASLGSPAEPGHPAGRVPLRRGPLRRGPGRRRGRRRERAIALAGALATAVLVVGAPVALASWLTVSPHFRLDAVEVTAEGRRVPAAWAEARLAELRGVNLLRLSHAAVTARLAGNPWLAEVEISKRLPGTLRVRLVERRAAVILERSAEPAEASDGRPDAGAGGPATERSWADAEGRLIAPLPADRPTPGLLVVAPAPGVPGAVPKALAVAGELERFRPAWSARLARIEVLADEDFRLVFREAGEAGAETDGGPLMDASETVDGAERSGPGGPRPGGETVPAYPVLVRPGSLERAGAELAAVLPEVERRLGTPAAVDLRVPGRIVVRPRAAARPRRNNGRGA